LYERGDNPAKNQDMTTSFDGNAPLHGKRLLVVEDEFLIQLDIQRILEDAGAQVIVTAGHVADAIGALAKAERSGVAFDAAVLDLKLERESSAPVAQKLTTAGVPFVLLTGAPGSADEIPQFDSAPVIGKPFNADALLAALETAMTRRR
jgi:DNA-binding response OmpR family regulator